MLNAAVITNNVVSNIIYIDEVNMKLFNDNGLEVIDGTLYGLTFGDYREDNTWYRDIDGVKTKLPLPIPKPEETDQEDMLTALTVLGYTEE